MDVHVSAPPRSLADGKQKPGPEAADQRTLFSAVSYTSEKALVSSEEHWPPVKVENCVVWLSAVPPAA
jgi:hypothetical protein